MNSKNSTAPLAKHVRDNSQHDSLPNRQVDYFDRFLRVDDYLNNNIHPHVNTGATAHEPIWLTDHGPDHIATVIQRAGDLAFPQECVLTPYEAYILLMAAHFHDIGNVFGRKEHEKRANRIMFELDHTLIGDDALEKRTICYIAMAHGGYVNEDGDKDTIGKLPFDDPADKSKGARVKKLAAILRLADELADDNTRTSRFIQRASGEVFPESEIFHMYASRLRPISIDHDTRNINLRFELNTELVNKKCRKQESERYLFDEILDRSLKMHREHLYCRRFMLPDIVLDRINVHMDICTDNYSSVLGQIDYTMAEGGYPDSPQQVKDLCPRIVTAKELKNRVASLLQGGQTSPYVEPPDLLAAES